MKIFFRLTAILNIYYSGSKNCERGRLIWVEKGSYFCTLQFAVKIQYQIPLITFSQDSDIFLAFLKKNQH